MNEPKNRNYAAVVVSVGHPIDLPGLDNLVGVEVLGYQALTTRGIQAGELRIAFTAETQLDGDYCVHNNLFRDATLNKNPAETGYLDKNRRVRALKLRGHTSNALLMPLSSVAYTGVDVSSMKVGDTFDVLNGHDICCKYEIPRKHVQGHAKTKVEKAFKRVDKKLFPEHLETDQYHRNKHLLKAGRECVVTQKLHGTSIRVGRVPCLRQKSWWEKLVSKLTGIKTPDYEYDVVYGSRKVIKDVNNPRQDHYYDKDIWTTFGQTIADQIPEGVIVYGELVGWTPDGQALQKNYTYGYPQGEMELFVYRVAHINRQGYLTDLSWQGVKDFCQSRGLRTVPELIRFTLPVGRDDRDKHIPLDIFLECFLDARLADFTDWNDLPLTVAKKTVDEGVCFRQEGLVPLILKAKSPIFLEHETKLLDTGEADLESVG